MTSRRSFLQTTAWLGLISTLPHRSLATLANTPVATTPPWYRRTLRWGQTNITEPDPARYDIDWWRDYWRRTATQGVIINAGGIFAYYPSTVPFHRPARQLNGRDLLGDLTTAARAEGLAIIARIDSNSAHPDLFAAHPDWFARDLEGHPYRHDERYIACVNSPYYDEHIPAILREIATRYQPDGFADNNWSGLDRNRPCHCENCARRFHEATSRALPRTKNWNDAGYRAWLQWNYARRLALWDQHNRVTRAAGGPHCLWIGMNGGSITGSAQSFRDLRAIAARSEMLLLDAQRRYDDSGFPRNAEIGQLLHGLLGWDKNIPESMALYQMGTPTYRYSSKPAPEARLWMLAGIVGGIQPWWHHVGAYHEDRRMYRTAAPILQWHREHEQFLVNRTPVATVGLLWSQQNHEYYGRDEGSLLVDLPWRGFAQALIRARIPHLPVHLDDLDRQARHLRVLVLPDLAALSDAQADAIRRFVAQGGSIFATGHTSLCNEFGDPRPDFALADLFGAHLPATHPARDESARIQQARDTAHTYLRLTPEQRAAVDGPHHSGEPPAGGPRHPILQGFDETDILPFGGTLAPLTLAPTAQTLLTFIPPSPSFPPEAAWMREPKTNIPGLILHEIPGGGRVAYLPADLDRRYARDNLPDHGNLLANLVRWAAGDDGLPLTIHGPGLIDCRLYHQPGRLILHLLNATNAGTWRQPVDELIPIGPLSITVRLPTDVSATQIKSLVATTDVPARTLNGLCHFEITSLLDHEVVVIT